MATAPSYEPVSPIREFPHDRAEFNVPHFNHRSGGNEGGIDSTFSSLSDRSILNVSNNDSSNGCSSQSDGQGSRHSPLAGGSATCRSREGSKSESSRVCGLPDEPWKQQQSHFRPWLASSESTTDSKGTSSRNVATSKRSQPYDVISPKQHHQKIERHK